MKKINCPLFEVSYKNRKAGHFLGQAGSFCHQLGRAIRELTVPIKAPLKRADLQNDVSVVLRGPGRQLKTCWNW